MKMAKPSQRDIDAAGDLLQVLDFIDARWGGPWPTDGPENLHELCEDFDRDDESHLQALYNHLAGLLRRAPNFHGRVIGGMCYVICWDHNGILDPAEDVLELHPDIRDGLKLLAAQRRDFIPSLERQARAAVAAHIEQSTAAHLAAMRASWAR